MWLNTWIIGGNLELLNPWQTPLPIYFQLQPNSSQIINSTHFPGTFIPVFKLDSPPPSPWFIRTGLHGQCLICCFEALVPYKMNLAASDSATGVAAKLIAAPHVASAIDADIASTTATLGKSRLFDVGGCSKGSSNKSKEDGGGLHFGDLEGLKS